MRILASPSVILPRKITEDTEDTEPTEETEAEDQRTGNTSDEGRNGYGVAYRR